VFSTYVIYFKSLVSTLNNEKYAQTREMITKVIGTIALPLNEKSPTVPFITTNNRNAEIIAAFDDFIDFPIKRAINPSVTVTTDFKTI
jgi:hypothetical protein